jgi:hypothetical protein
VSVIDLAVCDFVHLSPAGAKTETETGTETETETETEAETDERRQDEHRQDERRQNELLPATATEDVTAEIVGHSPTPTLLMFFLISSFLSLTLAVAGGDGVRYVCVCGR